MGYQVSVNAPSSAHYASLLRLELCERSVKYHKNHGLQAQYSFGSVPVVVYEPDGDSHGNFLAASYQRILDVPAWKTRLSKVHTSSRVSLPKSDRKWCELDSCNSSDALLMNIFCYPGLLGDARVQLLLGIDSVAPVEFGFRARVPLENGKFDRTEVDMRIGSFLAESKLTEADFQRSPKAVLEIYRDFRDIFDRRQLPQTRTEYLGYQLIRNVLAAHALDSSFCVLCDARRPDLIEQWYAVMRCVQPYDVRARCKVLTWQELAEALPQELCAFLNEKYGIVPGPVIPYMFEHLRE